MGRWILVLVVGIFLLGVVSAGETLRWEDMNGNEITTAEIGDSVRMVLDPYSSGVFEIKERDGSADEGGGDDDDIRVGGEAIGGVEEDGSLVGVWTITRDDFEKGGMYSEGVERHEKVNDQIEVYFTIASMGESGLLYISKYRDDDPMNITIKSPFCGEDFNESSFSDIVINASDSDNNITGNITIDGEVWGFSNGGRIINDYKWKNSGNVQVEVFARNTRGYMIKKVANVMIKEKDGGGSFVDADYVAACIGKPEEFGDVGSSNVWFNASNSRGLKCVSGSCSEVLVGGLKFSWRFSDGLINPYYDGGNPLSYNFFKNFLTAGDNWAVLDVKIV